MWDRSLITRGIADVVGARGRVVGGDSNPALIDQARQLHRDVPQLEFEVGDIFNLTYKDEFHIVTSARVLQWLPDPLKALETMISASKMGGKVLILDYNHEKISWEPEPPLCMQSFYTSFLKWRSDAGMDNKIADNLLSLFEQVGLDEIKITLQHELTNRMDHDFHERISIWADVAASRGIQMVKDDYLTEQERATGEKDYREWIDQSAMSQKMYLLAVEGTKSTSLKRCKSIYPVKKEMY